MEVDTAVRRMLAESDAVKGQTQERIWRHRLQEKIEGTGGAAIVVSEQPAWTTPDPVNTNEYPVVWVDCVADCTRDADRLPKSFDALDKAKALARVVDSLMHAKRGVVWGGPAGLMIVSSARWGKRFLPLSGTALAEQGGGHGQPDEDSTVMVARTIWALNVAHDTNHGGS